MRCGKFWISFGEILLQFHNLQRNSYYINRVPFHFRRRGEAVLRRSARLFLTSLKKILYVELSRVDVNVLVRLITARCLK